MKYLTHFAFVASLAGIAGMAACSSGSDSPAASGGAGNTAGAAHGGAATAGAPAGGAATAGAPAGGAATAGAPAGGAAGAGTAGAGTAGSAGASGGAGGASAGAGGAGGAGGASAGAGGAAAGAAGSTGVDCADESTGVGVGAGVTTAVVVIDNVVVTKAATVAAQWQFADGTKISDVGAGDAPPADMWAWVNYTDPNRVVGPHDTFLACAGNPAAGSLKNVIPFTADNQFYQVRVVGAPLDSSGATITANVKLVGGGRPVPACAAGAFLYAVDNTTSMSTHAAADPFTPLKVGVWTPLTLSVPATGFTTVGQIAVQISTYSCGAGM